MSTINDFPTDVWRKIVSTLNISELANLVLAVNSKARYRIFHQAVSHLEWQVSHIPSVDAATKNCIPSNNLTGLFALNYRKIRSVALKPDQKHRILTFLPLEVHLRSWGPTLVTLKLNSHLCLISLLSSFGHSLIKSYHPNDYCHDLIRLWRELRDHDDLPTVRTASNFLYAEVDIHPRPDVRTLTSPWLPLREFMPQLEVLHLIFAHQYGDVAFSTYSAEYIALLWLQLPDSIVELCHNLTAPLHSAMLPYLPKTLKKYISPGKPKDSAHIAFAPEDERHPPDEAASSAQIIALPLALETLILPYTALSHDLLPLLPTSMTRLWTQDGPSSELLAATFPPNITRIDGYARIDYNNVHTLPSNLRTLRSPIFTSTLSEFHLFSLLPKTLTWLYLAELLIKPDFSVLPRTLKKLEIYRLFISPQLPMSAAQLATLPPSLTYLQVGSLKPDPLTNKLSLNDLPCNNLSTLIVPFFFFIVESPVKTLPFLKVCQLHFSIITKKAVDTLPDSLVSCFSIARIVNEVAPLPAPKK